MKRPHLTHFTLARPRVARLPMSGNRTSQRSCLRHVPPKNGNFKYAPLIRARGHDQASKISSALAVSICSEKKPARDTRHHGEHPLHPWCGPWPSRRENPLHVQTKMNCLGCQRIRKKSFAHDRCDLCKVQNSSMAMAAAAMTAVVAQPRVSVSGATVKRPIWSR
jgi:hypothetical protein